MNFYLKDLNIKAVYFLCIDDVVVYIGKSRNLKKRLYIHLKRYCIDTEEWKSQINKIKYIECVTDTDTEILETYFINEFKPIYNKDKIYLDRCSLNLGEQEFKEVPILNTETDWNYLNEKITMKDFVKLLSLVETKLNSELSSDYKARNLSYDQYQKLIKKLKDANIVKEIKNIFRINPYIYLHPKCSNSYAFKLRQEWDNNK